MYRRRGKEAPVMKRIAGLDQFRFILAIWVLLSHCQLVPDFSGQPRGSLMGLGFRAFANNFFNPVAAVIVFFVISGFCIHLPHRNKTEITLIPYFTRRFIRILTPMAAALLLAIPLRVEFALFSDSILWSLVCEEIYYLIYPGLRRLAFRVGWGNLFIVSFVIAFGLALSTWDTYEVTHGIYPAFGPHLVWLLGLPCWLLGCVLAERLEVFQLVPVTQRQIWSWRFTVWLATWICSVLKFHSPVGYPLTLNFFAILAFYWIQREIAFYRFRQPVLVLEKAGRWSYSMYLIHLHAQALYVLAGVPMLIAPFRWVFHLAFLLSICYAFYLLVELPSHNLARHLSRQLSKKTSRETLSVPIGLKRGAALPDSVRGVE
jgi:peptidoglycan/LPS O-acetylase OafA/YrhL